MPSSPKVSVILTSYNHAKYLRESIDSVLAQTFEDFELIIWDDASTDDSWEIINSYSDPRIQAFRNEANQHGGSIRRALERPAQGEYIAIQHSDDVWEPEKLKKQVEYLNTHQETGAVFTQVAVINEDGAPFEDRDHFYYRIFDQPNRTRYEWLNFFFYQGNALCHPSALLRRGVYEQCGPVRFGMAQIPDLDMWVRLCLKYELHILPEKLVRFRVRSGNLNVSAEGPDLRVRMQFESLQVLENYRQLRQPEEFLRVFPEARKYQTPGGMDVDYALARTALETLRGGYTALFALQILFELLNDPRRAARLRELHGFGQKEFLALSAVQDVFSSEILRSLWDELAGRDRRINEQAERINEQEGRLSEQEGRLSEQETHIQGVDRQLEEIYRSKGWILLQRARRIRVAILPNDGILYRAARRVWHEVRKLKLLRGNSAAIPIQPADQSGILNRAAAELTESELDELSKRVHTLYREPAPQSPTVSIIIPVHNQIGLTLSCLVSLAASRDQTCFEVIVIDDASTDRTRELLEGISGVGYLRNNSNQGFLLSCNEAAKHANGNYLVLLNNDTLIQTGWLEGLLETFTRFPQAGLVGSKLIFPDGRMQEAGGVIFADGSAMNYGRDGDPRDGKYNYVREVDYVSGASVMLPKKLWEQLGGFDEKYLPAYYEDVDLAFRVRQAGYKVIFQPFSQVIHCEGASNGTDLSQGIKRHQVINQSKFFDTWSETIADRGYPGQTPEHKLRNRFTRAEVLFIDDGIPKPDHYAGAVLSEAYITALRQNGYAVTFLPHVDLRPHAPYTSDLQWKGVECLHEPYVTSSVRYIQENGRRFDYVILSRANVAADLIDVVKQYAPQAKLVFSTIDLHFVRLARAAEVSGKEKDVRLARQIRDKELNIIQKVDSTLVVSDAEQKILSGLAPHAWVEVVPFPADVFGLQKDYADRHDIVFLGGFGHVPNVDAVKFFAEEIWPLVSARLPEAHFVIAGAEAPDSIRKLASPSIIVKGYVPELGPLFENARLSVAPIRFGAGIKGKVLTSLGYGVPCVATSIAAEGIGLIDGKNVLIADTPEEYANAILKAYTSAEIWKRLSDEGQNWILEKYSRAVISSRLMQVIEKL